MVTQRILTKLVEFYLKGQLPPDITVHTVKYRTTAKGEYYLISDVPEWQRPAAPPAPLPGSFEEQITLEPVTVGEQAILAGYGEVARILMIGRWDPGWRDKAPNASNGKITRQIS